ncbi:MAG: DNA cytosine methyltransferase, partial [Thermomicrobiales bacterium]
MATTMIADPFVGNSSGVEVTGLRSVELFTGAGGLALGTHAAGFDHRLLLEWNTDARATLLANARRASVPGIDGWQVVGADAR